MLGCPRRRLSALHPDKYTRESVFHEPDWDYVHKKARIGVNLQLLHDEYKADCARRSLVAIAWATCSSADATATTS